MLKSYFRRLNTEKGFTLIEILIVIGIIAILAAIVIVAVNPARQFAQAKNAQRRSDVNAILNATYQFAIDQKGSIPAEITTTNTEICATGVASSTCTTAGLINLGNLTTNETYLVSIPLDPDGATTTSGTGYHIFKSSNGRVTVTASGAELDESISVTR